MGTTVSMSVSSDWSVCASVKFPTRTTFVGELSAVGAVNGPGTITQPVLGIQPIAVVDGDTWSSCLAGAYAATTTGAAGYTFVCSSVDRGEVFAEKSCYKLLGTSGIRCS